MKNLKTIIIISAILIAASGFYGVMIYKNKQAVTNVVDLELRKAQSAEEGNESELIKSAMLTIINKNVPEGFEELEEVILKSYRKLGYEITGSKVKGKESVVKVKMIVPGIDGAVKAAKEKSLAAAKNQVIDESYFAADRDPIAEKRREVRMREIEEINNSNTVEKVIEFKLSKADGIWSINDDEELYKALLGSKE